MPTNAQAKRLPLAARRVLRLALILALSLALGYGLGMPMPFLAPLFAWMLCASPGPPMGPSSLVKLLLVLALILGLGLIIVPVLEHYPATGLLLVGLGIYAGNYLAVNRGQAAVGMLVAAGFTLIPAAGVASFALAVGVIQALIMSVALAIVSQWLVYPWFPEDSVTGRAKTKSAAASQCNWIARRATVVVMPAFLLALVNPAGYMPLVMKTVMLSQQATVVQARDAGRELLGSTLVGGCMALLFWFLLDLVTTLWMFAWWMALFGVFVAGKFYRLSASRFPPSFWQNALATMLILLGPAVEDSADGKDVYLAFAIRMALFIAVTLYAWLAVRVLDQWRDRRERLKANILAESI